MRAFLKTAIAGQFGRNGKYYLFHQSRGGAIAIGIVPNKAGEAITFRLEYYHSGGWHRVASDVESLDGSSVVVAFFDGRTNTSFRVRGEYHGDVSNAGVIGRWWYVQFR